jgi:hypothetical protein
LQQADANRQVPVRPHLLPHRKSMAALDTRDSHHPKNLRLRTVKPVIGTAYSRLLASCYYKSRSSAIHGRDEVCQGLLSGSRVGFAGAWHVERAMYGLVNRVPLRRRSGARLTSDPRAMARNCIRTFPRLYIFPIFEAKHVDLRFWSSARRSPLSSKLMRDSFCKSDKTHPPYGRLLRAEKGTTPPIQSLTSGTCQRRSPMVYPDR